MTQAAAAATVETVRECLPRFGVAPGPTRRRRSTWLDTADWLLHRKGLSCELLDDAGGRVLVLHGPQDERLEVCLPAGTDAPLRLEHLPPARCASGWPP